MSATQSWFGREATKFRSTRSAAGLGFLFPPAVGSPRAPQLGQFLTLGRRKPGALLLPAALLPVGLRHPVADRLCSRFKLPGKLGRISAGADQLDHLTAKLG